MKSDIHPPYRKLMVQCACGNQFETRSTAALRGSRPHAPIVVEHVQHGMKLDDHQAPARRQNTRDASSPRR